MKNFELSNMGRRAVTSHLKSATHTKRSQSGTGCYNISSLLTSKKTKQQDVASSTSLSSSADASTSQTPVEAPMTSSDVNTSSPSAYAASVLESGPVVKGTGSVGTAALSHISKVDNFMVKNQVTDSEIVWALKILMNHLSFNSCKDLNETFRLIFLDSSIAQKFALSPAKVAYTIVHGIAPYFSGQLVSAIQECPFLWPVSMKL